MANVLLSILFPFQRGVSAYPVQAVDDDVILSSIIQIIMTPVGERIMRPLFGSKTVEYVFETSSSATADGLETEIRTSIARWEPRVRVESITFESGDVNEPGETLVTVAYTNIATNTSSSVTVGI